jgi:hypothetical protein
MGEEIARKSNLDHGIYDHEKITELYLSLAEKEITKRPKALTERMNSLSFMTFAFEDYQIVLSNSISSDRILKVIPQGNEFGRVLKRQKAAND